MANEKQEKRGRGRPPIHRKTTYPLSQICADIKVLIKKSGQKYLKRNVETDEISKEELDILFNYFPISLVTGVFGGNYQIIMKDYNYRQKTKETEDYIKAREEEEKSEDNYEPVEPAGIGGWRYRERLKQKAYRELEKVMNKGIKIGGSQYVNAVKTLLAEATKDTEEAADVMSAYENQLILMAGHIVENFLPNISRLIKNELHRARDDIQKSVEKTIKETNDLDAGIRVWRKDFNKFVRQYEQKRFELLFAESMAKSKELNEAFDFSRDLIETFIQKDDIAFDTEDVTILKKHTRN